MNEEEVELGDYKGVPIESTKIIVKKLGDGLSKAVSVSPSLHELNETVYIVVRAKKTKDRYEAVCDDEGNIIATVLVQEFDANAAHFTSASSAAKSIDKVVAKIQEAEAAAKGQLSFETNIDGAEIVDLPRNARKRRNDFGDLPDQVDAAMRGAQ